MPKKDDEQTLDVIFPGRGLDTSGEYGVQRPDTSADATNVRSVDPLEERFRGGSRHGIAKYVSTQPGGASALIQHLNQLVTHNADFLHTSFEYYSPDFVADPSTNNGGDNRNPGRDVPPLGSGVAPSRTRPLLSRRRIQAVASPTTQTNGTNSTITSTLTALPGGAAVGSVSVRLNTLPPGRNGDGNSLTTSGAGTAAFTVNEASYEGPILYITTHEYVNALTGLPATVTGIAQVVWTGGSGGTPYVLDLTSTDGLELDADGKLHSLVGTLTKGSDAVPNRSILLQTSPRGEVGDLVRKTTSSSGAVTFRVSNTDDEVVIYTAQLLPSPSGSSGTVTDSVTITWGNPVMAYRFFSSGSGAQTGTADPVTVSDEVFYNANIVNAGDLIVICHQYGDGLYPLSTASINPGLISDTVGTTFQLAGVIDIGPPQNTELRIFYGIAAGTTAASDTLTIPISGTAGLATRTIRVAVYSGANASSPFVGVNSSSTDFGVPTATTIGPGSVSTNSGGIVVAWHYTGNQAPAATAGPPGTNPTAAMRTPGTGFVNVADLTGCVTGTASATITCTTSYYIGIAASFKP